MCLKKIWFQYDLREICFHSRNNNCYTNICTELYKRLRFNVLKGKNKPLSINISEAIKMLAIPISLIEIQITQDYEMATDPTS